MAGQLCPGELAPKAARETQAQTGGAVGHKEKKLRWQVRVLICSTREASKAPPSRSYSKACPGPSMDPPTHRLPTAYVLHDHPWRMAHRGEPRSGSLHSRQESLGPASPTGPPPGTGSSLPLGIIIIILTVIRTVIIAVVKSVDSKSLDLNPSSIIY